MINWTEAGVISLPQWLLKLQHELQSRLYTHDTHRFNLVLRCAALNRELDGRPPLAAAVFSDSGALISVGVASPGIRGHEISNALIFAANIRESGGSSDSSWDLFSVAPPSLTCQGNLYAEIPRRYQCAVNREDVMEALPEVDVPTPSANWKEFLERRGIVVSHAVFRERGREALRGAPSETFN